MHLLPVGRVTVARRAANAIGEHLVGVLYANGLGAPRDLCAAVTWLERAARQGLEESKQTLHELASKGVLEAAAAVRRLGLAP